MNRRSENTEMSEFLQLFASGTAAETTYEDILYGTELYEKILELPDEITVSQYITSLRQIAKKFKLTADFDSRVKPYRDKALKQMKEVCKPENAPVQSDRPKWWDGEVINEDMFCEELLSEHRLYCINGLTHKSHFFEAA